MTIEEYNKVSHLVSQKKKIEEEINVLYRCKKALEIGNLYPDVEIIIEKINYIVVRKEDIGICDIMLERRLLALKEIEIQIEDF